MPKIPLSMVDMAVEKAMTDLRRMALAWAMSTRQSPAPRAGTPAVSSCRVRAGNTNRIPICPIEAKYDPSVTLADALQSGNVKIMYKSVATKVLVDGNGKITGIDYVRYERDNGPPMEKDGRVTAKVYILAGNAIAMLSAAFDVQERGSSSVHLANHSGFLGKHLMHHPLDSLAWALMPKPVWGYRGPLSTAGIEICRDGRFPRGDRGAFRIQNRQ